MSHTTVPVLKNIEEESPRPLIENQAASSCKEDPSPPVLIPFGTVIDDTIECLGDGSEMDKTYVGKRMQRKAAAKKTVVVDDDSSDSGGT